MTMQSHGWDRAHLQRLLVDLSAQLERLAKLDVETTPPEQWSNVAERVARVAEEIAEFTLRAATEGTHHQEGSTDAR